MESHEAILLRLRRQRAFHQMHVVGPGHQKPPGGSRREGADATTNDGQHRAPHANGIGGMTMTAFLHQLQQSGLLPRQQNVSTQASSGPALGSADFVALRQTVLDAVHLWDEVAKSCLECGNGMGSLAETMSDTIHMLKDTIEATRINLQSSRRADDFTKSAAAIASLCKSLVDTTQRMEDAATSFGSLQSAPSVNLGANGITEEVRGLFDDLRKTMAAANQDLRDKIDALSPLRSSPGVDVDGLEIRQELRGLFGQMDRSVSGRLQRVEDGIAAKHEIMQVSNQEVKEKIQALGLLQSSPGGSVGEVEFRQEIQGMFGQMVQSVHERMQQIEEGIAGTHEVIQNSNQEFKARIDALGPLQTTLDQVVQENRQLREQMTRIEKDKARSDSELQALVKLLKDRFEKVDQNKARSIDAINSVRGVWSSATGSTLSPRRSTSIQMPEPAASRDDDADSNSAPSPDVQSPIGSPLGSVASSALSEGEFERRRKLEIEQNPARGY